VNVTPNEKSDFVAAHIDRWLISQIEALPRRKGAVLDLPAGDGLLTSALLEAGYTVTAADLFPEGLQARGLDGITADMNQRLPFDDAQFDTVVSQEGVEHLENLPCFFRESFRVLRPHGTLFVTTPNFMDLSSKLANFFTGMKSFNGSYTNEETTLWGRDAERFYHGHAFQLPYLQMRYLLRLAGFEKIELHGHNHSPLSSALYPIVWPIGKFLSKRAYRRKQKRDRRGGNHNQRRRAPSAELQKELECIALSRELLCFRKIAVIAHKSASRTGDRSSSNAAMPEQIAAPVATE